jgi:hypothetical protein
MRLAFQSALFSICVCTFSACSGQREEMQRRWQQQARYQEYTDAQRRWQQQQAVVNAAQAVQNHTAPNIPVMSSTPQLPTSVPAAPVSVDRPPG